MRILVAEDSAAVRRFLLKGLTRYCGHQVDSAKDGLELVKCWKRGRHPVVISDVDMPGKDGIEACLEILSIDPTVHVIMMSGLPSNAERADESGLGPCLVKPFTFAGLLARLPRED